MEMSKFPINFYHNDDFEDEESHECGNKQIITNPDGIRVCAGCGVTFGREMVNSERKMYNSEEAKKKKQSEKVARNFGHRTVIGINKDSSKHQQVTGAQKTLYTRLNKIQISLVSSIERNYWEAFPKIRETASRLTIPKHILETAWKIYGEVAKQKLTMGRSIRDFTTASLYAAIRVHNFPRLFDEVLDVAMLERRPVHHSLGLIVQNVLPKLKLKYCPVTSKSLVFRFCSDLGLSMQVQTKAVELIEHAKKNGLRSIGKDPKGLAAGAIYLAARKTDEHRTQERISDVAKITEVTLRSRVREISKTLK